MNRTPIQLAATIVGLAFLLAGIGGFIPGITTDGHLLGIFEVSTLHNIVHLLFGVAGLAMAGSSAKTYLVGGGVLYLIIWAYGMFFDLGLEALPINAADNMLHLGSGIGMVALGVILGKTPAHRAA
jgi:ABC-type transport system involved in multi-copper enzyme maturation permease subunit